MNRAVLIRYSSDRNFMNFRTTLEESESEIKKRNCFNIKHSGETLMRSLLKLLILETRSAVIFTGM